MKNHECKERFHCWSYPRNQCDGCVNCINVSFGDEWNKYRNMILNSHYGMYVDTESAKKFINEKFGHGSYNYIMTDVNDTHNLINKVIEELLKEKQKENKEMDPRWEEYINKKESWSDRQFLRNIYSNPDIALSMDRRLRDLLLEMNNKQKEEKRKLNIKKVIFNEPATIVLWEDGTKTVVKCGKNDIYDKEKGLAMCIAKRALGDKGSYYNEFSKWLPVDYVPIAEELQSNNAGIEIRCRNCKNYKKGPYDEPCLNCYIYSRFEPGEN